MTRLRPQSDIEHDLSERDARHLHRLTGFNYMAFALMRGVPHRIVPREHWSREEGLAVGPVAELRCQCGVLHVVRLGASPQSCRCERWFFFDGTDVWALLSPASSPS